MIEVWEMMQQWSKARRRIWSNRKPARKRKGRLAWLILSVVVVALPLTGQDSAQVTSTAPAATAAGQAEVIPKPLAQQHNSDVVAYWYGPNYRTPFVVKPGTGEAADIRRNSVEYSHVGSWGMVNNFADVMANMSDMAEPAASGGSGATEAYVILRSNVGLNQATDSSTFHRGPLRDLSIEVGANLETKNSSYAPSEKTIYVGPNLQFSLPRGFFNVGLHLRKEWNHEGVLGKSESYDPGFNIEPTWMLPFAIGKAHLTFSGFADYNTPKGKDSFGTPTVGEFLIRSIVAMDIGGTLFHRSRLLDLSGGLWYWHNMYGKPASAPGAEQMTPIIGMALHLDGFRTHRE
jgi:hypothetical protein